MNTRYFSSALLGVLVTGSLLWLMQTLIASGPEVYTKAPPRLELGWIFVASPEVIVDAPPIDRPPPPPVPPRTDRRQADSDEAITIPVPAPYRPRQPEPSPNDFGQSNSPLVDVMYVKPVYPADAVARGLEGFVTVGFDVTELGTVTNIRVLESSHRVFEKPAREAALRSKFRPRVVDGVAMATTGIVRRYRFELDQ
jgi:periplasmic protein TonB